LPTTITMTEQQDKKVYQEDGIRPIGEPHIEIADTFQEDGIRPIGESPDFLVSESHQSISDDAAHSQKNREPENTNIQNSQIDISHPEVVDTFEADGERPIMADKYKVVDTLNIDGQRPITSDN
jgi:hypothetical protein